MKPHNLSSSQRRLVLGTAQLGTDYGISNRSGKPDLRTAISIINTAWESGICEFDTAAAYGESEQVLGKVLTSLGIGNDVKIISKFHPNLDHLNHKDMKQALEETLSRLKISQLYGLLLHREESLDLWDKGLGEILDNFVRSGHIKHLGVSVYSPSKAIQALETDGITIVQLPTNILDRRFEQAGVFNFAQIKEKTIYIRSVFLQGLLLMNPYSLPGNMGFAARVLKSLQSLAYDVGLSVQALCIGYIKNIFPQSRLVFGAELPMQIKENTKCWNVSWPKALGQRIQKEFKDIDETLLNPCSWPKDIT